MSVVKSTFMPFHKDLLFIQLLIQIGQTVDAIAIITARLVHHFV